MVDVTIIVEGKADKKFLQDYIKHIYAVELNHDDFIVVNGNQGKLHLIQPNIKSSTESGKTNILIFDADQPDYQSTLEALQRRKEELDVEFDTFLLPNNANNGNLETLLRSTVNPINEGLFECIESYANCATAQGLDKLRTFDKKAKIYVYVDSFVTGGDARVDSRDYTESGLWDLNSKALNSLKGFLDQYFRS